jgi:hypothetical protein
MKHLKAFVIGSSFPVVFCPFFYLGVSSFYHPEARFSMDLVPIFLPFIFGFYNVLILAVKRTWYAETSMNYYLAAGSFYGLCLSLYGNFAKDIPVDLFQLPDTSAQYIVIPIAALLYALVWRYIAGNLNRLFAIE